MTAETFYAKVGFKTVRETYHGDARTIVMERHPVGKEHERVAMGMSSREEVRANIDRLDREIIGLMTERGNSCSKAARFKSSHADLEPRSGSSRSSLKVRALAVSAGLEPRVMISAFIEVERAAFQSKSEGE